MNHFFKQGFFEITCSKDIPKPENIDFSDRRRLFIVLKNPLEKITYKDKDIRVVINNRNEYTIETIEIFNKDNFNEYKPLFGLYKNRNKPDERYTLIQLLDYAKEDNAKKKEKYLTAVIDELNNKGYFNVVSPVALYDNILVGRKRSFVKAKQIDKGSGKPIKFEEPEAEETLDNYSIYKELLNENPNLILYGPPGTGKTYSAMKIIEYIERERTGVYLPFNKIIEKNRVEFVTFHQSFTYEEFIEGIRPVLDEESESDAEGDKIKYKVEDGILKAIANRASLSQLKKDYHSDIFLDVSDENIIYKVSLGLRDLEEHIYNDCIKKSTIAIGWLEDIDLKDMDYQSIYSKLVEIRGENAPKPTNDVSSIDVLVNRMMEGDIVLIYAGSFEIRDIGIISSPYFYDEKSKDKYPHRRKVKWIKHFDSPVDIRKINGGKRLTLKTIYELNRFQFSDIKDLLKDEIIVKKSDKSKAVPYYLIIDEINRGNISKIFGELITLLEEDKRDNLTITLPYSKKTFSFPANLYLLGTMNTADRSIAIIDTALRRRFTFVEVEPNVEIINNSDNKTIGIGDDEIDLGKLFVALNDNIIKKFDRDHRLGHSYFLDIYSLKDLKIRWYYKILPLLMEYFYNDGGVFLRNWPLF